MDKMKIPAGLRGLLLLTITGSSFALIGGCEYMCSECTESSSTSVNQGERPADQVAGTPAQLEPSMGTGMDIDPELDGDADMKLVQMASTDSSQSSR